MMVSDSCAPAELLIQGGFRNMRTITGALLSSARNVPVILASIEHQDTAYTKQAAYQDLKRKACNDVLGDLSSVVLDDKTTNGARLADYAVNIFILNKELPGDTDLTSVSSKLKKAVNDYKNHFEKGFASNANVSSDRGYALCCEIDKMIGILVDRNKGVFDTAAGTMYEMYLSNGLPKALGNRLGLTLDEQTMANSSFAGNASRAANMVLVSQLNFSFKQGGSSGLTDFLTTMLNQLDLSVSPGPVPKIRTVSNAQASIVADTADTADTAHTADTSDAVEAPGAARSHNWHISHSGGNANANVNVNVDYGKLISAAGFGESLGDLKVNELLTRLDSVVHLLNELKSRGVEPQSNQTKLHLNVVTNPVANSPNTHTCSGGGSFGGLHSLQGRGLVSSYDSYSSQTEQAKSTYYDSVSFPLQGSGLVGQVPSGYINKSQESDWDFLFRHMKPKDSDSKSSRVYCPIHSPKTNDFISELNTHTKRSNNISSTVRDSSVGGIKLIDNAPASNLNESYADTNGSHGVGSSSVTLDWSNKTDNLSVANKPACVSGVSYFYDSLDIATEHTTQNFPNSGKGNGYDVRGSVLIPVHYEGGS